MLNDFIKDAAGKLGIGEDTSKDATGALLGLIKDKADDADFAQLANQIPGVREAAASAPTDSGGGGLGGMLGGIGDLVGGGGGGALGALGALSKTGLGVDKIGDFAGMFTGFLKKKIGGDLLKRLLGNIPGLSNLVG